MKLITLVIVSIIFPSVLQASLHLGIECQGLNMPYNAGYGDNLLNRSTVGINPIIGYRFNENIGIEGGFRYHSHHRTVTLKQNEVSAGEVIGKAIAPAVFDTSMRLKGPHINLVISTTKSIDNPLQLFMGFGLSETKATFYRHTIQAGHVNLHNIFTRKMEQTRTLRRLMVGANYYLTENLAIRCSSVFEDTNKFKVFANDGVATARQPGILPKRSINYGVGFSYHF